MLTKKSLLILTAIFICIAFLAISDFSKLKRIGSNGVISEAKVQYKWTSGRSFRDYHIRYVFSPIGTIRESLTFEEECEVPEKQYNRININDKIEITYNRFNLNESFCGDLVGIETGVIIARNPLPYLSLVLLFILLTFATLYLIFSKRITSILGNHNVYWPSSDALGEALGYYNFKPNLVVIEKSTICIRLWIDQTPFIIYSTIIFPFLVFFFSDRGKNTGFSNFNSADFIMIAITAFFLIYQYSVLIRNVFFSKYFTNISLSENTISFKNKFEKESTVYIDDFSNISFSFKMYFNGLRRLQYKVLLHYGSKKYVILCDLFHKKQAQYAVSTLETATKSGVIGVMIVN